MQLKSGRELRRKVEQVSYLKWDNENEDESPSHGKWENEMKCRKKEEVRPR